MSTGISEWQFDGLVGPTHNYAGLSFGNVASLNNKDTLSNPRAAALQGIAKMRLARSISNAQGFFLPHYRDIVSELKRLGFTGNRAQLLEHAARSAPELLASVYSSSAMWAANAATVTPSMDAEDGKLHFTPANLISHYHRSLEPLSTTRMLRRMFADTERFTVHDPLPATLRFSDEGAANHLRLAPAHGDRGLHVFVYGASGRAGVSLPKRFPARQQEEACRAIARRHRLREEDCLFVQQHPDAIDAGIFHHDVAGMSCLTFLAQHESAWVGGEEALREIADRLCAFPVSLLSIRDSELSMGDAVSSYFYNSQLLSGPEGIVILAPEECRETPTAKRVFDRWLAEGIVARVEYLNLRESMRNGGGPACLRLRIVLSDAESAAIHQGVVLTDAKADQLENWVRTHYRDRLSFDDLRDPLLMDEVETALDALTGMVGFGSFYDFQR